MLPFHFIKAGISCTDPPPSTKEDVPMNSQNNSMTLREAKKSLYRMNLIDDFLLNALLSDADDGPEAARIILSTLLRRNVEVVSITPQKVFTGPNAAKHGIRLDAYVTAKGDGGSLKADIYDVEAETRVADPS